MNHAILMLVAINKRNYSETSISVSYVDIIYWSIEIENGLHCCYLAVK